MTEHTYTPGDEIIVAGKDPGRERYYVGPTRGGRVAYEYTTEFGEDEIADVEADRVSPAAPPPPLEIPDGWQLMRSDDLVAGKHEVHDPRRTSWTWAGPATLDYIMAYPHLLVAREHQS